MRTLPSKDFAETFVEASGGTKALEHIITSISPCFITISSLFHHYFITISSAFQHVSACFSMFQHVSTAFPSDVSGLACWSRDPWHLRWSCRLRDSVRSRQKSACHRLSKPQLNNDSNFGSLNCYKWPFIWSPMNFAINFDLFHLHDIARHSVVLLWLWPNWHRKAFAFTSAFVRAAREDGSLGTIWWQMRHRKGWSCDTYWGTIEFYIVLL